MTRPRLALTMVLCGILLSPAVWGVTLVADGRPHAVILRPADGPPCTEVAARELQSYIQRMSGAQLPIREIPAEPPADLAALTDGRMPVFVGPSRFTRDLGIDVNAIPSEGFVVDVRDDALAIVGRDGDSYGANYRYMTASAGTLYGVYHFLETLGVRWYYPGDLGTLIPSQTTIDIPTGRRQSAPFFSYRHTGYGDFAWGRRISAGGDRDIWSTRHTCSIDLYDQFHETHPEWFLKNADGQPGHQADLAHPEVVDAIAAMAAKRFETRPPGQRYYLVIPLDGRAKPEDDARSAWVASATVQVARKLQDSHPQGRIVYCAYNDYRQPPRDLAQLPPNVVVLIAQSRSALFEQEDRQKAYELVRSWQQRRPQSIAFCRYNGNRLRMMPALIPHVVADDIARMKSLSQTGESPIVGEMNFVSVGADSPFSWWEHLNQYVAAKLLWDPDRSVDALLDDFCDRFFGPAAEPMRAYLGRCEQAYLDPEQRHVFSIETIDALGGLLEQAARLAQGDPAERRVRFFEEGYASLARVKTKLSTAAEPTADADAGLIRHVTFDDSLGAHAVRDQVTGSICVVRGGTWVEGIQGKALSFNQPGAGVYLGPVDLSQTDYTLEAWIRPDAPRQGQAFIIGPDAWERHALMVDFGLPTDKGHSGRLVIKHRRWERGENIRLISAPFEFIPGRWTHVAGTFSRTNGMAVYIDGRLCGLNMDLTKPSDMSVSWIGASGQGATENPDDSFGQFPGAIDEVRIYRRELSVGDIRAKARLSHP